MKNTTSLKDTENVIGPRVAHALDMCGWTQMRLADELGLNRSAISRIIDGTTKRFALGDLQKIADLLGVSPLWLTGFTEDPHSEPLSEAEHKAIPILGTIAAGAPLYAAQNIEGYLPVLGAWDIQFALRVKGDSMIDACIHSGDLVICRGQSMVDNGEIAVVIVDGEEATLKRFFKHQNGIIELRPANVEFHSLIFTPEDMTRTPVQIVGRAVYVVSEVR